MKILFLLISLFLLGHSINLAEIGSDTELKETLNTEGTTEAEIDAATTSSNERIDKATDDIFNNQKTELTNYFTTDIRTTCESVQDLLCPPLLADKTSNYMTLVKYINPLAGEVMCQVFPKNKFEDWREDKLNIAPVMSRKFVKKACVDKFQINKKTGKNMDKTGYVEDLRTKANEQQSEFNEIKSSYDIDYKMNGGEKFLDLGDWLDALSTLDSEKIDVERTLKQKQIHTTEHYTVVPNTNVLDKFQEALISIKKINGGVDITDDEIENQLAIINIQDEENKKVANSSFIMYLDFFIKSSDAINGIVNTLIVVFVLFNIAEFGYGNLTNHLSDNRLTENFVGRGASGLLIVLFLYVGNVSVLKFENEVGQEELIEVKQQRILTVLRWVYEKANSVSDDISEIAISSYLDTLANTSEINSVDKIDSLSSERILLVNENSLLKKLEEEMCSATYNLSHLDNTLSQYREDKQSGKIKLKTVQDGQRSDWSQTLAQVMYLVAEETTDGDLLIGTDYRIHSEQDIIINPYPKSELEALLSLRSNKINPYNDKSELSFINQDYFSSSLFQNNNNQLLSLSGCNYNRRQVIRNNNRIYQIDDELVFTTDNYIFQDKVQRIKDMHSIMWKNFAEMGYLSMAFLPATAMLVDNQGVLGDKSKQLKNSESEDGIIARTVQSIPYLALFGGRNIAGIYEDAIGSITSIVDDVPFLGSTVKGAVKGASLYLAYETISVLLKSVYLIVLVTASILAFIMITLQKSYAFFVVIFLPLYAFHPQQEKIVAGALVKIVATAFKTVLIVVSIFIAIWSGSLLDSLHHIFQTTFVENMQNVMTVDPKLDWIDQKVQGITSTLQRWAYSGVSNIIFTIVKIILSVTIIFKLPGYFYSMLEVKVDDVGDKMLDVVADAAEKQGMKGL